MIFNLDTRYYRWRRRKIRARAKAAAKADKNMFPTWVYMKGKDRKNYERLGLKWYSSMGFQWGMDLTGKGLSKQEISELSHLNDYERENKPLKSVPDRHIDVTFRSVYADGKEYTLIFDNGVLRNKGNYAHALWMMENYA